MINPTPEQIDALKAQWTDKLVQVTTERPELRRFVGRVGRVVTVNFNGKALIDFADGAWYDITASDKFLSVVDPASELAKKYDSTANSAQPIPAKGG
jgi:hypothetical protein